MLDVQNSYFLHVYESDIITFLWWTNILRFGLMRNQEVGLGSRGRHWMLLIGVWHLDHSFDIFIGLWQNYVPNNFDLLQWVYMCKEHWSHLCHVSVCGGCWAFLMGLWILTIVYICSLRLVMFVWSSYELWLSVQCKLR